MNKIMPLADEVIVYPAHGAGRPVVKHDEGNGGHIGQPEK